MNPTDLAGYYASQGTALPSVSNRAGLYSSYGLGSGYAGTAAQNQALLSKLMGGGSSPSPSGAPASQGGGYGSNSSTGGYSVPSGDPTLSGDFQSLNQSQNDLQNLTAQQAAALNQFTQQQQGTIANAYQTALAQVAQNNGPDLNKEAATMNALEDAINSDQNATAAVTPQTIAAAGGSFANNDQVGTQENTSNIPYAEQLAQHSADLVPAENAYNTTAQQVANTQGSIVTGAQLAEQGFTAGQQEQLAALESRIQQGQALTNDEYQTYATLQAAQTAAAAQTGAASIGAGASTANTASTNALNKFLGQLTNPGSSVGSNGVGTFNPAAAISGAPSSSAPSNASISSYLSKYGF